MATLRERLDAYDGQPEQQWVVRKNVSIDESGQKYIVSFSPKLMSAVYGIDGGIIKDKKILKCDKLILACMESGKWLEIFVELKGRDIRHAIEQIEATINNALLRDMNVASVHARVIGRSIPRSTVNSITEIAKKRFISKYNCRLEFKSGPYKETFNT